MNPIMKKLCYKEQGPILVIGAPPEFDAVIWELQTEVHRDAKNSDSYTFILLFCRNLAEARVFSAEAVTQLKTDGLFWVCYPKGSSKKYKTDLNRTTAWDLMAAFEFEPVSQVAIDDDWSAIRYRHVDLIKSLKRKTAATEKGRERIRP